MLAVGLVGFTVIAVAAVGPWLLPGLDWRVGLVLGSVVATTDAIAATSMAKRIGLPKSIVDLLEGESLINDATGLLALEFATAIVVNGQHPTAVTGTFRLLYLSGAAIASGLAVARVVEWLGRRIDDGPIEVAVDLLAPYAAYFAAEAIHASGVLAVVSAGLYLGHRSSLLLSPGVRIRMRAVWDSLAFILNGFVFVLIGLQLPSVLEGVSELSNQNVILYSALFSVCLIIIRLIWTYPGAYLAHVIRTRLMKRNEERLNARQTFVVGWIGMRGVIALAAAMSLPAMTADGRAFPHRDLIVFLTFSVILTTLVIQGLTLTPLVRVLRLDRHRGPEGTSRTAAGSCSKRLSPMSVSFNRPIPGVRRRYMTIWRDITNIGLPVSALPGTRTENRLRAAITDISKSHACSCRRSGRARCVCGMKDGSAMSY